MTKNKYYSLFRIKHPYKTGITNLRSTILFIDFLYYEQTHYYNGTTVANYWKLAVNIYVLHLSSITHGFPSVHPSLLAELHPSSFPSCASVVSTAESIIVTI